MENPPEWIASGLSEMCTQLVVDVRRDDSHLLFARMQSVSRLCKKRKFLSSHIHFVKSDRLRPEVERQRITTFIDTFAPLCVHNESLQKYIIDGIFDRRALSGFVRQEFKSLEVLHILEERGDLYSSDMGLQIFGTKIKNVRDLRVNVLISKTAIIGIRLHCPRLQRLEIRVPILRKNYEKLKTERKAKDSTSVDIFNRDQNIAVYSDVFAMIRTIPFVKVIFECQTFTQGRWNVSDSVTKMYGKSCTFKKNGSYCTVRNINAIICTRHSVPNDESKMPEGSGWGHLFYSKLEETSFFLDLLEKELTSPLSGITHGNIVWKGSHGEDSSKAFTEFMARLQKGIGDTMGSLHTCEEPGKEKWFKDNLMISFALKKKINK
ncbi:MAG: hypothetical protein ACTSUE_09635 [Promethearchaeota archaeon]